MQCVCLMKLVYACFNRKGEGGEGGQTLISFWISIKVLCLPPMLCIIIIEELGTTDVSSVSPFPKIKFQEICNELFNEISQVVSLQFQEGRSNFKLIFKVMVEIHFPHPLVLGIYHKMHCVKPVSKLPLSAFGLPAVDQGLDPALCHHKPSAGSIRVVGCDRKGCQ